MGGGKGGEVWRRRRRRRLKGGRSRVTHRVAVVYPTLFLVSTISVSLLYVYMVGGKAKPA